PDNDFLINKETPPWMAYWNTIETMNRAFKKTIVKGPRLKVTPFAFGGNMVIHRHLFSLIPFDPLITRGEDIDFLLNARLFGYKVYLDNQLAIKHAAPPKSHPLWRQLREDIFRFIYEKSKLEASKSEPGFKKLKAEDLDPYPGEFLKEDLKEKIYRCQMMLAVNYLSHGEKESALECMKNIYLAETKAKPRVNPVHHLIKLQKNWKKLMAFFASEKEATNVCKFLGYLK
ncbi:MAG: glycosyltransferase family 2 protein, partial [Candidatus Aminicenantales bacterium]